VGESNGTHAFAIRFNGLCNHQDPRIEFFVAGQGIRQARLKLDDVDATAAPNVLAMAIAEQFSAECAPAKAAAPQLAKPAAIPSSRASSGTSQRILGVTAAAESLRYLKDAAALRGATLALHMDIGSLSLRAEGAWATAAIEHPLGTLRLQNLLARGGVEAVVLAMAQLSVRGALELEVGQTRARARADLDSTATSETSGLSLATRIGPTVELAISPSAYARVCILAGLGRGVPVVASGETIASTAGASVRASVGLGFRY
jgi:hypothetical protein